MTTIKWKPISNVLKKVYQEQQIVEYFEKDEMYLKNAFEKTENHFEKVLNKIAPKPYKLETIIPQEKQTI